MKQKKFNRHSIHILLLSIVILLSIFFVIPQKSYASNGSTTHTLFHFPAMLSSVTTFAQKTAGSISSFFTKTFVSPNTHASQKPSLHTFATTAYVLGTK